MVRMRVSSVYNLVMSGLQNELSQKDNFSFCIFSLKNQMQIRVWKCINFLCTVFLLNCDGHPLDVVPKGRFNFQFCKYSRIDYLSASYR